MITNIRARFSEGVLTPLDPLDLPEGEEVTLHIENGHSQEPPSQTTTSDTPSLIEMFDNIREAAPGEVEDTLPPDLSKNIDHYLYGVPREHRQ